MTDQYGGLLDASQQAVRMERLEGRQDLLAQQVKSSIDAVTGALNNVQLESRALVSKVGDLANLQSSHDANRAAIEDMRLRVAGLDGKLDKFFDDFERRQEARWREHVADRDVWRQAHERLNDESHKTLSTEVRNLRETMIRYTGWGAGIGLLAGVVVAGFLWTMNLRFSIANDKTVDLQATTRTNRAVIDAINEHHTSELTDIKLYLARGGRIPEDPYVPQAQRKVVNGSQQQQPARSEPGK